MKGLQCYGEWTQEASNFHVIIHFIVGFRNRYLHFSSIFFCIYLGWHMCESVKRNTLLAFTTPTLSYRRPLQRRPLLALFFKCSRSNSHRQIYNTGPFNAISRKITPFRAGVIKANRVASSTAQYFEKIGPFYFICQYL